MSQQRHRPQGFQRTDRIADFIQRELAVLISRGMKDPRLGMVTIQHVKVASDLGYADVYFTLLGEDMSAAAQAEQVLTHAAGFLRSSLAKQLNTRITPKLRFHYDSLQENASRLTDLIDQTRKADAEKQPDNDPSAPEES